MVAERPDAEGWLSCQACAALALGFSGQHHLRGGRECPPSSLQLLGPRLPDLVASIPVFAPLKLTPEARLSVLGSVTLPVSSGLDSPREKPKEPFSDPREQPGLSVHHTRNS